MAWKYYHLLYIGLQNICNRGGPVLNIQKEDNLLLQGAYKVRVKMLVNLQIFLYLPEVIALCFGTSMAISLRL
jgi:hypothetical protein